MQSTLKFSVAFRVCLKLMCICKGMQVLGFGVYTFCVCLLYIFFLVFCSVCGFVCAFLDGCLCVSSHFLPNAPVKSTLHIYD